MFRDTRFVFQLSLLTSLIAVALYILNFVSLAPIKKQKSADDREFLVKLSQIDSSFDFVEIKKMIKPAKVVVVQKEVIKEIPVVVDASNNLKREKINKTIKPAKESYINISSTEVKKREIKPKKHKKTDIYAKLKARFQKTHDYKIALKLSRLYYTSKKYKNSLKWAMIANELNERDDGSWILFAKTKLKMGDIEDAKKALLTYESVYDSKRVKELLSRISS